MCEDFCIPEDDSVIHATHQHIESSSEAEVSPSTAAVLQAPYCIETSTSMFEVQIHNRALINTHNLLFSQNI